MHGLNRKFLRDPQKFLDQYIILMPDVRRYPWQSAIKNQTFDLRRDTRNIFGRKCCLLTTMARRGKGAGKYTHPIHGSWIPMNSNERFTERFVVAGHPPYFIFTEQLGGCSIGILNKRTPFAWFAHNPDPELINLREIGYDLTLTDKEYGDQNNTSGVCWWDGSKWNIGFCVRYESSGACHLIEQDYYAKDPPTL